MARVVITGGAGLIGSTIIKRLLDQGDQVVCVDNLVTGSWDNIAAWVEAGDIEFINHDVSKPFYLDSAVDVVMHFASPASPKDFSELPIQIMKVGGLGTHNTLGLARANNARYLLASTSEVYGDPLVHPQVETYWGNVNPIGPRGVYDEAKRFAEALTMAYHRHHGLDVRIARIFNTYGPSMRLLDGRVVSNFLVQALQGKPLTVYGDGQQTRSFCYVDDEVDGLLRLLDSDYVGPVNIGNPVEFTMLELAQEVNEVTGADVPVVFQPLPVDDPAQRQPDITLAKTLLGWEPKTRLRDGLSLTAEAFAKRLVR